MSYVFSTIQADRLASLALEAAIQADRKARGARSEIGPLIEFADAITQFAGIEAGAAAGASRLDPSGSEMLGSAVTVATKRSISNIDRLNSELLEIVSGFKGSSAKPVNWQDLKKFCLEVHRLISGGRSDAGLHEQGVFDYDHSYTR